ncbi:MAG: cytochrome b [Methylobacter sp.]
MTILEKYNRTAIVLHWLIAVLIIANVVLGLLFDAVSDEHIRMAIDTHKSIGITVLGLVLLRILWRVTHHPPPSHTRVAKIAHMTLYLLILALPISGWLHDSAWKDAATYPMTLFGYIPWPRIAMIATIEPIAKEYLHDLLGAVHNWFGYVFYGVLGLHIAGAIKHQYVDKHSDKHRGMLPNINREKSKI